MKKIIYLLVMTQVCSANNGSFGDIELQLKKIKEAKELCAKKNADACFAYGALMEYAGECFSARNYFIKACRENSYYCQFQVEKNCNEGVSND